MIREMRLRLSRPIVAITSTAAEAEALAGEAAFFLDEDADADAATRRVHLLRSWEVKPMAQLSPPTDAQASQLAALFAMLRQESPLDRHVGRSADDADDSAHGVQRIDPHGRHRGPPRPRRPGRSARGVRLSARAANRRGGRLQRARRTRRCVLAAVSRSDSYRTRRRSDHFDSPFRRGYSALGRRPRRGDDHAHALRAAVCAEGPQAGRSGCAARCRNRDGAQGGGRTVRSAREWPAVPRRGTADAVCVRAAARQRVRLHAGGRVAVAGRSGAHARRGQSLRRSREQ